MFENNPNPMWFFDPKENITTAESIGIQSFLVKPYTAEKLLFNLNKTILA